MSKPSPASTADSSEEAGGEVLPAVARAAIIAHLTGKPSKEAPPAATGYLAQKRGVYVTIRDQQGEIRGNRGSVEPQSDDLVEETRQSAIAASEDPRYPPIQDAKELKKLTIEVTVLGSPERVESIIELDPEIYGVILTATKTGNRGVMMPHMPGLNTVDKQLAAIRREAGLRPDERLKIERFRAEKFAE